MGRKNSESEHDEEFDDEDEITIEEQVIDKIKHLPTLPVKIQAIALNGYLIEKRALDQKLEGEVNKVEVNYRKNFEPYLKEIFNIASGAVDLTDEDLEGVQHLLTEEEKAVKKNYYPKKPIQEYWLKAFITSDAIGETIQPDDEDLLKHLVNLQAEKSEDGTNLSVTFHFSENAWFTNANIKKQFEVVGNEIKRSFGDAINWKEGKNVTVQIVKKKNKKKKTTVTKQIEKQSFFNLFKQIDLTEDNDDEQDKEQKSKKDDGQEEIGEVEKLERQYEICNAIYEELLPRSLEFYLGVVGAMDLQDLMGLGGEDAGEDDDDEEEVTGDKKKKSSSKNKKRKGSHNSKQ